MKKLFLAAAIAAMATQAQAALFHFTGNLTYHNDVARIDFNVAQDATNVRVWTDSFMSGQNFDPITALWKADGTKIEENDDDSSINPQTQTSWDSGFSLQTLAAGNYIFTLAAYNNFANATLANRPAGFAHCSNTRCEGESPLTWTVQLPASINAIMASTTL